MSKLSAFENLTLDGYFTDPKGDLSWAHMDAQDEEFNSFVAGNAQGGGPLILGRITYDMMVSYWPTPQAKQSQPEVAEGMNKMRKIVFSKTLNQTPWENTRLVKNDPVEEVRKLKQSGEDMTILGSGTIVSQLTQAGLIDEYQFVVNPVVLGDGRTLFDGVKGKVDLKLSNSRSFRNGKVLLSYTR